MNFFYKLIQKLFFVFIKKSIIFESVPDFTDNTYYVYREMIKRGLNKKYHFFWRTDKRTVVLADNENKKHTFDLYKPTNIKEMLLSVSCLDKTVCGICCNQFLFKNRKEEKVYFLGHGGPYKATKGYYSIPEYIDCTISMSEYLSPIIAEQHNYDVNKIVALGYPRNDILTSSDFDSKAVFGNKFDKIIIWYPTYRQHKNSDISLTKNSIPLLYNEDNAIRINETAKKSNTLILIKPHFAQDVSKIKTLALSNLQFIDDSFYTDNNVTAYEFIANCDALITDYSSVYYDYTLCDKPIAVIWEDIEEYKKYPGFAVDLDEVLKGAEKIYTEQQLSKFIKDVADGKDNLQTERREVCKMSNYAADGKSTQRVTDYIIKNAGL